MLFVVPSEYNCLIELVPLVSCHQFQTEIADCPRSSSFSYTRRESQKSVRMTLEAGKAYYMEVTHTYLTFDLASSLISFPLHPPSPSSSSIPPLSSPSLSSSSLPVFLLPPCLPPPSPSSSSLYLLPLPPPSVIPAVWSMAIDICCIGTNGGGLLDSLQRSWGWFPHDRPRRKDWRWDCDRKCLITSLYLNSPTGWHIFLLYRPRGTRGSDCQDIQYQEQRGIPHLACLSHHADVCWWGADGRCHIHRHSYRYIPTRHARRLHRSVLSLSRYWVVKILRSRCCHIIFLCLQMCWTTSQLPTTWRMRLTIFPPSPRMSCQSFEVTSQAEGDSPSLSTLPSVSLCIAVSLPLVAIGFSCTFLWLWPSFPQVTGMISHPSAAEQAFRFLSRRREFLLSPSGACSSRLMVASTWCQTWPTPHRQKSRLVQIVGQWLTNEFLDSWMSEYELQILQHNMLW